MHTKNEPHGRARKRIITAFIALNDGWHTTRDIANAMGRKQLWRGDRGALERLVADGLLEVRQVDSNRGLKFYYEYKVIGKLINPAH